MVRPDWTHEDPDEGFAPSTTPARGKMSRREEVASASFHDVLQQRKWWRRGDGSAMRRRDMDINHKLNALGYLLREAPRITATYANQPVFHSAPDDVWADLQQMVAQPERWIVNTPMWRALLQDVMAFADIGPEDLGLEPFYNRPAGHIVPGLWTEKRSR